jgi:hypothetical protein
VSREIGTPFCFLCWALSQIQLFCVFTIYPFSTSSNSFSERLTFSRIQSLVTSAPSFGFAFVRAGARIEVEPQPSSEDLVGAETPVVQKKRVSLNRDTLFALPNLIAGSQNVRNR